MRYIAGYLLAVLGGNESPSVADVTAILASAGVAVDAAALNLVHSQCAGKSLDDLIAAGAFFFLSVLVALSALHVSLFYSLFHRLRNALLFCLWRAFTRFCLFDLISSAHQAPRSSPLAVVAPAPLPRPPLAPHPLPLARLPPRPLPRRRSPRRRRRLSTLNQFHLNPFESDLACRP
jgi:hypothetical protein